MTSVDGAPVRSGALAWRLARQGLSTPIEADAGGVVRAMLAVRAWPADVADVGVRIRQASPAPDGVAAAIRSGDLVAVYAFGGGSYLATPRVAALLHAARLVTGVWRTERWQSQGDFVLDDWEPLREAVRARVAEGPATRAELGEHLAGIPALAHVARAAAEGSGADSLVKPLHWFGDLRFGPSRDGEMTFRLHEPEPRRLDDLDLDAAGRTLVALALAAHGPLTGANLEQWIGEGLGVPRRRLAGWVDDLGAAIARIDEPGDAAMCLAEDAEAIVASSPSDDVHLIPGHDPWIRVPGTADAALVAPARRAVATRGANLVLHGGVVAGTWRRHRGSLLVSWFDEAGPVPSAAIDAATARLAVALDAELRASVERV